MSKIDIDDMKVNNSKAINKKLYLWSKYQHANKTSFSWVKSIRF